jgi:hypothetical protein
MHALALSEHFFSTDHSFQARFWAGSRPPDPGQGRLELTSAPNECFSKLLETRPWAARRGVGRQILAQAVRSPKVLQINAFLSFGDTFLGGASAARSGPRQSGAQKCSKFNAFLSFGDTFLGGASAARSGPRQSGGPECSKSNKSAREYRKLRRLKPKRAREYRKLRRLRPTSAREYRKIRGLRPKSAREYLKLRGLRPHSAREYRKIRRVKPKSAREYRELRGLRPKRVREYSRHT